MEHVHTSQQLTLLCGSGWLCQVHSFKAHACFENNQPQVVNLTCSNILIEFDCFSIRDTVFSAVIETTFLNTLYILYIIIHRERDYMYYLCIHNHHLSKEEMLYFIGHQTAAACNLFYSIWILSSYKRSKLSSSKWCSDTIQQWFRSIPLYNCVSYKKGFQDSRHWFKSSEILSADS